MGCKMPESRVLLGLHVGQPCLASVLDNHAAEAGKRGHKVRGSLLQSRFESFACAAWCLAPVGSKQFLKVRQPIKHSTFVLCLASKLECRRVSFCLACMLDNRVWLACWTTMLPRLGSEATRCGAHCCRAALSRSHVLHGAWLRQARSIF